MGEGVGKPVRITAWLEQGAVLDSHYGLALDGVLASVVRRRSAEPGTPGSLIDGGLDSQMPVDWPLPFAVCSVGEDWHWAVGHAVPVNRDGSIIDAGTPDVHRLMGVLDDRRVAWTARRILSEASPRRGRYRNRIRPVLTTPAAALRWHGVGDPASLEDLLGSVEYVGGRRGSGEGRVVRWQVEPVTTADEFAFVHAVQGGRLSRPMPVECAQRVGGAFAAVQAGLRPPYFHASRQAELAVNIA